MTKRDPISDPQVGDAWKWCGTHVTVSNIEAKNITFSWPTGGSVCIGRPSFPHAVGRGELTPYPTLAGVMHVNTYAGATVPKTCRHGFHESYQLSQMPLSTMDPDAAASAANLAWRREVQSLLIERRLLEWPTCCHIVPEPDSATAQYAHFECDGSCR
jgi:hypothetical protein